MGPTTERRQDWFQQDVKQRAELWYQKYVLELILRRKALSSSNDGRHIPLQPFHEKPLVDPRRHHPYISNTIRSSRYTIWDFLPKQFLFQVTRLGNFYFICIGVPQAIPGLSNTGSYTTILPLLFFILLTVAKEGYDDYKRHRLDKVENTRCATVIRDGRHAERRGTFARIPDLRSFPSVSKTKSEVVEEFELKEDELRWKQIQWQDIKVGDIIKLERDDAIPADTVLLYADAEDGIAYIETMALDGETNLKSRQALPEFDRCNTIEGIRSCKAEFVVEDPNPDLYNFNGRAIVDGESVPLTLNEVVYRGSVLRNTKLAIGLVINTGEECKIRMNANHHPKAKKPRLEKFLNQVVLTLVVYVILLTMGCSVGYLIWRRSVEKHSWYLKDAKVSAKEIIIGYAIEFNNVIPLALYVSLEIVKIGQALLLSGDVEMYDETSDAPARCNTNTILENLGQVNYILSDKTGTLTENVMRFRKISVAGTAWLHEMDIEEDDQGQTSEAGEEDHDSIKSCHITATAKVGDSQTSISPLVEYQPRSSFSTWRSAGRPDHLQPGLTTKQLLEYIHLHPASGFSKRAREFILATALCHTCLPEVTGDKVDFQASSPDELALVRAAQELGYVVVHRSSHSITLLVKSGSGNESQSYEILDIIEFSSKRKRMSIIVRCPDGRIWLLCKGADNVILPRLKHADQVSRLAKRVRESREFDHLRRSQQLEAAERPGVRRSLEITKQSAFNFLDKLSVTNDSTILSRCLEHVDDFANEGLRTLLFGHKFISPEDYSSWRKIYREATTSLTDRQDRIEEAGELIEQSLDLLGASAIEDKLQQGVPETIDRLRRANIRIWMLTGDKRETAIKIAHSARLVLPGSKTFILDSTVDNLQGQIRAVYDEIYLRDANSVLVIDGHTLAVVESDPILKDSFYRLIASTRSVICCRASPAQKASIVSAIKAHIPGSLTLAIGDGANDIAMIQAADVGVGISGKEGLQAARVADYSIAQFRFLQRLLLVHGHWNYVRTAKFILMTFWKEMFFYMMQALYQRYNGYTGTSLYESWSLTVLNTLFTSLCVIIMGIFEQDLSADTLLAVPEVYLYGQNNAGLNLRKYLAWMLCATAEGMVVWFFSWAIYGMLYIPKDQGLFAFGDLVFTLAILWTNTKLFIGETHCKTIIVITCFSITIAGWWAWNAFLAAAYTPQPGPYSARGGFTSTFGTDPIWWLTLILVFAILVALQVVYSSLNRNIISIAMKPLRRRVKWFGGNEDSDIRMFQEMEQDPSMRERLKKMARDEMEEPDVEYIP
ncbi:hypothetical protein DTO271D3_329 [Paecilomyces variotii]|nr:hypothetical protein DTO271D3_329 [Paecilomyces variotii]